MIETKDIYDNTRTAMSEDEKLSAVQENLVYNTQCEPLKMPEYGRLVLQMVQFAMTIENRDERTAYAHKIVRVMAGMNPQMKHIPDYQLKLWDHLAYLSDYKLDIDYPVEIRPYGEESQPERLSYPGNKIKLRHYGHLVELLIQRLLENLDTPERETLIIQIAERMRRNLLEWKGDSADDERIARDIAYYTQGKVEIEEVLDILSQLSRPKRGRRNG